MSEPRYFTPKTQDALARTLQATREVMEEVRGNVQILEEGRARADKRIENLKKEIGEARQALADAAEVGKEREEALEHADAARSGLESDLAASRDDSEKLRGALNQANGERDALAEKTKDFQRILDEKTDLEGQLAEATEAMGAQENALADLEERLDKVRAGAEKTAHDADERLHRLQEDMAGLTSEKERLMGELASALAAAETQAKEAGDRVDGLEADMAGLTDEQERLMEKLAEAEDTITGLNAQLASEGELRGALDVDLDVARRAIRELKDALEESRGESIS